ncbi:hypothetical protein DL770_008427 [Monosporascus sp. CRB-9-2]|nr:hypothetical protein DL770_008427 [Monosporascus sp. CRB-9-2]
MPRKRPFSSLFTRNLRHHGAKNSRVPISITIREPVPLDRSRPSVAQLPDHIVRLILSFLQDLSPEDILTVASLSSSLYEQARYVQHRVVHIDLDKRRHVHHCLDLIIRRGLLPAIRTLEVSGQHYDELLKEGNEILTRLADMLPRMTGLRDLHWQVGRTTGEDNLKRTTAVPIPAPIMRLLPPELRLHTSVFCAHSKESHAQAREFLDCLVNKQNLRTLSVQISFIEEQDCLETMRALKKVLLSCPNLTRLPLLDVWYPCGGCEGYGPPLMGGPYCGLGLSNGERPPPLEELGMRKYPWGMEGARHCQGYPEKGFEWDYWAKTFDWSRLTRLNDISYYLAPAIAPRLTGLRELTLEHFSSVEADFLQEITSPLEILSISGWSRVDNKPNPINKHGATLRKLKIHRPERGWRDDTHSFLTAADLAQLSNGLPHLEELAIDIARDENANEWPYEALDAIARFPSLRTAELWFPLGFEPPAPRPFLTVSSARHLFSYLRKRNVSIQRLILHSGAPVPPVAFFASLISREPSWAMRNSVNFVCNMVYDGDAEERRLIVTCPDLSRDMNAQLSRLAKQADRDRIDPRELDADWLRLKAALDGPLTMDEWKAWQHEQRVRWRKAYREQNTVLGRLIIGPFKRVLER